MLYLKALCIEKKKRPIVLKREPLAKLYRIVRKSGFYAYDSNISSAILLTYNPDNKNWILIISVKF